MDEKELDLDQIPQLEQRGNKFMIKKSAIPKKKLIVINKKASNSEPISENTDDIKDVKASLIELESKINGEAHNIEAKLKLKADCESQIKTLLKQIESQDKDRVKALKEFETIVNNGKSDEPNKLCSIAQSIDKCDAQIGKLNADKNYQEQQIRKYLTEIDAHKKQKKHFEEILDKKTALIKKSETMTQKEKEEEAKAQRELEKIEKAKIKIKAQKEAKTAKIKAEKTRLENLAAVATDKIEKENKADVPPLDQYLEKNTDAKTSDEILNNFTLTIKELSIIRLFANPFEMDEFIMCGIMPKESLNKALQKAQLNNDLKLIDEVNTLIERLTKLEKEIKPKKYNPTIEYPLD